MFEVLQATSERIFSLGSSGADLLSSENKSSRLELSKFYFGVSRLLFESSLLIVGQPGKESNQRIGSVHIGFVPSQSVLWGLK